MATTLCSTPIGKGNKRVPNFDSAVSIRELKQTLRTLSALTEEGAVQHPADNLVKGVPACGACPKNTANAPLLFPDHKTATCTDVECFTAKKDAKFNSEAAALAKKLGKKVALVSHEYNPDDGAVERDDWREAKEGECKNIQPAIIVPSRHSSDKKKLTTAELFGWINRSEEGRAGNAAEGNMPDLQMHEGPRMRPET
jgi:hypothetical protein